MDSLKSSLDELEDAAMQLVDGFLKLSEGADTKAATEFDAGIQTLKTGIDALELSWSVRWNQQLYHRG